ncbi:MAG: EamA family transporter [Sphingobacteriaceae bacterium]|nr:EamA family transporter [Sphingobacteriaceae bacterium]
MIISKTKYYSAALSAAIIWGFFAIPLRSLKAYPAEQILYFRILFSLLFTWAIIILFRKKQLRADINFLKRVSTQQRKSLLYLTLISGLLITGNWYSFIYAINNVSIKSAAFAYMVCPLITATGGFLILKEKATTYKIIGITIALGSILLLAAGSLYEVLWSIFIAALYAFYLIIQRIVPEIDKLNMLGVQLCISTILLAPSLFYVHYTLPSDPGFWINIVLIALVFTILPLFLSLYALIGLDSSSMGILIYINPIIAFTVAFVYFDEHVTLFQAFSYFLLFIAVVLFNWGFIKTHLKISPPSIS